MDIGTKKEPGRELGKVEVTQISGGYIAPTPEEVPGDGSDGNGGAPVDYSNGI